MKGNLSSCMCGECVGACLSKPGLFMPDEIEPLAKAMGLTVQELFDRHLTIDFAEEYAGDLLMLAPRLVTKPGGKIAGGNPRGPCHWLTKDGLCSVHDLGKPMVCRARVHGQSARRNRAIMDEIFAAWRKPENQAMIRRLHGRPIRIPRRDRAIFNKKFILAVTFGIGIDDIDRRK